MLTIKLLPIVKNLNISKEEWEDYKKEQLEDMEEVDKYFQELEKKEEKPKLTDEEKEYLSAVIKPFRDKVKAITKNTRVSKEFIEIEIQDDTEIQMPFFKLNAYYRGMKSEKRYKLEELGL